MQLLHNILIRHGVKSDGTNPEAELFLFMKTETETNYFTQVDQKVLATDGNWALIEKTVLVPANIKKLNIRLDNNGTGNLWFDDVNIRKTSDGDTGDRHLNISYNTWKSPYQIEETNVDKISFTYNYMNNRSSMFYGGLQNDKYQRQYHKSYSADGTMEVKINNATNEVDFITYIGGDGYSAPIILKSDGINQNYLYLHRDYQGSIVAITNQAGAVVEKRLYDAWGEVVKVQDGQGNVLNGFKVLDRGYTGHEHLQSVGLIHMNGRLYDPKLHRFLQPDNFIQDPYNTQNYNRYGYVLNNPLKYTDPSGELAFLAAVGIGALIAATTYTLTALLADVPFSVGGLMKASFIGAFSAAVTFGIGSATATIGNFYVRSAVQAVAHGTFQGGMSEAQGGKFITGFASGSLSSIASSAFSGGYNHSGIDAQGNMINPQQAWGGAGSFAQNPVGMVAFGTVMGGAGASLSGGNFWQGAATGLVVSGLNHVAHKVTLDIQQSKNNGEVFNLADPTDSYDKPVYEAGLDVVPEANTITIIDHANSYSINGKMADDLNVYLMKHSKLYKESITTGKQITIKLYGCNTGELNNSRGVAYALSKINRYANVVAPNKTILLLDNNKQAILNGGQWMNYKNGVQTVSSFDKFFINTVKGSKSGKTYRMN